MLNTKKIIIKASVCMVATATIQSAAAATVAVSTEATVEAGASADNDEDESAAGYIFVKHQTTVGSATRKAYFQFDLTGENADLSQAGTFTFTLASSRGQALKFWALDQSYAGFASTETWNGAQANELTTNDLLTGGGGFTATQFGGASDGIDDGILEFNGSTGDEITVTLATLAPYVFDNKITVAISGALWQTAVTEPSTTVINGGMRLSRNTSTLDFAQVPEPSSAALLGLGGLLLVQRRRR